MNTLANEQQPQACRVSYDHSSIIVELIDGRSISAPLRWFPRLANAHPEQLNNWTLLGDGQGIHWPDIDEDISINGLLAGNH